MPNSMPAATKTRSSKDTAGCSVAEIICDKPREPAAAQAFFSFAQLTAGTTSHVLPTCAARHDVLANLRWAFLLASPTKNSPTARGEYMTVLR